MTTALATREDDRQIHHLQRAWQALELATTEQDVNRIYDLADEAEIYAQRHRLSDDVLGAAHQLKTEALIKLGRLLASTERNRGTAGLGRPSLGGTHREPPKDAPPTLAVLGISKKVSMLAQQLASLPEVFQQKVAKRKMSVIRAVLEHRRATAPRPPLPTGKYRVILADAPWDYGTGSRSGSDHYATMTIDEIAGMDVASCATDDAVLFFWVTAPLLFACQPILQAWGFTPKEQIIWDKGRGICGAYVDVRHEVLLVCTRGSCLPDRLTPAIASVQSIPRSKVHSQKPNEFYEIIERLYDGPYIELFARRPRAGWTSFGNDPALNEVIAKSDTSRRAVSQVARAVDSCAR